MAKLKKSKQQIEAGASLIEYCLLVIFIAVVAISSVEFFGGSVSSLLTNNNDQLDFE